MPNLSTDSDSSRPAWALLKPSLTDLLFPALLLAAFGRLSSWQTLLADGDTGWHIRTGDFILTTHSVPLHDLFSFSRSGQPWFAWEWLTDILFALLNRWHGLEAVAGFAAVIICLSAVLLVRWLLWRGCGLWIALPVALAVVSASSIHYLARPHIFSLLFVTVTLWLVDEDRRRQGRRVWLLVPLLALWANLHAGFVAGLAILVLLAVVAGLERGMAAFWRYGVLAASCFAATLLNPYGWRLHQHIFTYLGSSWILDNVQEFQSPRIRAENMQVFVVLLLFGVALVSRAFAKKQWFEGALVLIWGFAALRSARHVPLYAVAAAPLIAGECAAWWAAAAGRLPARSAPRILWELSHEFGRSRHIGLWTPALGVVALCLVLPRSGLGDFPADRFPVAAVTANLDRLRPSAAMPRILTSDQWADYLIFRLYPSQRVFFDGRSDFYGPGIGVDYQALLFVGQKWREVMERYRFDVALLPLDWPLGAVLENDPGWRLVDRSSFFVLLVRRDPALKEIAGSAECKFVSETVNRSSGIHSSLVPHASLVPRVARGPRRGAVRAADGEPGR